MNSTTRPRHFSIRIWSGIAAGIVATTMTANAERPQDRGDDGASTRGVDRGGITFGAVNTVLGFDISVGGTVFDASDAVVTVGGEPGSLDQIGAGQIVSITGNAGAGAPVAAAVRFDPNLAGTITAIDTTNQQVFALGQRVAIGAATLFDPTISPPSLLGLSAGDTIVVSGYRDAANTLQATRISAASLPAASTVIGTIADVNVAASQLRVNDLWVDYSSAIVTGFPSGTPSAGATVAVSGTATGSGVNMLADAVSRYEPLATLNGTALSVEGLVTQIAGPGSFTLSGVSVVTTPYTLFEGGTISDLVLNARLEVNGITDSSGVLTAERIEFRADGDIELSAVVHAVDDSKQALQLLGIKLFTDEHTTLSDDSDSHLESLTLPQLSAGDYVELIARTDPATGVAMATRLVRKQPEPETLLQGTLNSLDRTTRTLVVQGVAISTDPADADLDEFFDRAEPGERVKVEGNENGFNHINANVVELADSDGGQMASVEMEGLITSILSPRFFKIGNITVFASAQTGFENGTADDLAIGVTIRMQGTVANANLHIAQVIDFNVD